MSQFSSRKQCMCGHTCAFFEIRPLPHFKKLVGESPKPLNDFYKIGCAPPGLFSMNLRKGYIYFSDALVYLLLVLLDFLNIFLVNSATLIEPFGDLVFA